MRQVLAIARKEFMLWVQRPGSWIVVFIVPFFFIWIMQAVFGSSGTPVVTVFAVNEDAGKGGQQVLDTLRDSPNLKVDELETREEADRRVGAGERMAAIIIPAGYTDAIKTPAGVKIDIIVDPARSEQANIVIGLVNAALAPTIVDAEVTRGVESGVGQVLNMLNPTPTPTVISTPNNVAGGQPAGQPAQNPTPAPAGQTNPQISNPDSVRKFLVAALKGVVSSQVQDAMDNPQILIDSQAVADASRQPSLLDYLVPGYSLMFVFFLVSSLAMTMVEERQTGTLRRLLILPLSRLQILFGKILPYFLIGVAQFTIVLLLSFLLFGLKTASDPATTAVALGLIIIASAAVMAALGILVATFARSEGQASGIAIIVILAMAVVSGAMFPTITIPGIKVLTPHYWALQGFVNVIARGQGVEGALMPAGILLIMAAIFFTIGAVRFRLE